MKTFIITLITCFALPISYAQENKFIISTSFRFNNSNSETEIQKHSNNFTQINPRIMYKLKNKWGVGFLYAISKDKTEDNDNIYSKLTGNKFGGFIQYNLIDITKFQLFSELNASYTTLKHKSEMDTFNDISSKGAFLNINMGARYNLYKRFGIELRLNDLISYSSTKLDVSETKSSSFNLLNNPFQQLSYGISYSF
ncbi:outer membrane beta-barrel protein [Sphingobacterium bovistauri]|uniref:Outer membrane beta-barrel protein n=1 Tax=Sphingobacterium bovistauri TaxID=2781959 RepID=A0ABS7ZC65_9SPHI|nr:outer membrane beta-barrel protein [Sphingobacterium bovistauri]MCA5006475.1 outer membrane beta-barrel protein [Sphingobacterium bovistauri]